MKRVYVNEEWCLGCRLCEYYCVWSASGEKNFSFAFEDGAQPPAGIRVEDGPNGIHFAVNCRHCEDPLCMKGCISGALTRDDQGAIRIDKTKCVGCHTCVAMCPYGAIVSGGDHMPIKKCQLCAGKNYVPQCVSHCPNNAIVFEEEV